MDEEDLFGVFNKTKTETVRQQQHKFAGQKQLESTEYDGFCIDATPAQFDWRTTHGSASVGTWQKTVFQPPVSVPLPLARRRSASKYDEKVLHDGENGALPLAAAQLKRPSGNLCFNCGQPGHNVQCCPQPRDNNAINKRRKEWESERGARPSWMDEPRYFVAPSENKVAHVNAGILSSELCAALGITSSHLMPPPYLANMIREGYPPGFVGIDGEPAKMESEEETLRFICGGEEMDFSDEDHEDGKRGPTDFSTTAPARKAVMTVAFPGAFGAPPPPGVDPSLWQFPRRFSQHGESAASRAPSQMQFPQAQKQAQLQLQQAQLQLQKVQAQQLQLQQGGGQSFLQHEMRYTQAHSHALNAAGPPPTRPPLSLAAPTSAPLQPRHPQQREYVASEYYGGGGGHGYNGDGRGFVNGNAGNSYGSVYGPSHAADYRAVHYGSDTSVGHQGYFPPPCGRGWASNSSHGRNNNQQQSYQNHDNYQQQYSNYNQATQPWHGSNGRHF